MKLYSIRLTVLLSFLIFVTSCKNEVKKGMEITSHVEILPFFEESSFTPKWFDLNNDSINAFHTIPNFELINQFGDTITRADFEGKLYVADFFFTSCPGICPKMTENMSLVQEAFKDNDDVMLLSHSVTPEIDSVSVLREYADKKGAINGKWHLVTGDRKTIYDLGRYSYFAEEDLGEAKDENDFLHTENFILVDRKGHIRGIYNGLNSSSVQQLIVDINTLESE